MDYSLKGLGINPEPEKEPEKKPVPKDPDFTLDGLGIDKDAHIDEAAKKVRDIDADKVGKKLDISKKTGLKPSQINDKSLEDLHRTVNTPKPSDLINRKSTPVLARELAKAEKMALAHDDLESLSTVEQIYKDYRTSADYGYKRVMDTVKHAWQGWAGMGYEFATSLLQAKLGLRKQDAERVADVVTQPTRELAKMATPVEHVQRYGLQFKGWKPEVTIQDHDYEEPGWLNMVAGEVVALPLILGNLAALGQRGRIPLPWVMAGEGYYAALEETQRDRPQALMSGAEGYMFGSILEGLHHIPTWMGVKYLTGPFKPIPARMVAGAGAFGIPTATGGGTEEEVIAQAVLGAGFYAKDTLVQVPEILRGSKLAQRSPEATMDLLRKQIKEHGQPENILVDSHKLMELDAFTRRELLEAFEIRPDEFAEKVNLGEPVALDHAKVLMELSKHHEAYEMIREASTISPYERAIIENQVAEANLQLQELEAKYDYLFQEPMEVPREPLEQVHSGLRQAGYTKQQADTYTALIEAHSRVMAHQMKTTPAEYLEWRNLAIRGESFEAFKQRMAQNGLDADAQKSYDPNAFRQAPEPEATTAVTGQGGARGRAAGREATSLSHGEGPGAANAVSGLSFSPDPVAPHLRDKADFATRIDETAELPGRPGLRRATGVVSRGFGAGKPTEILYTARDFSRFGTEAHDPVHWEAMKDLVIVDESMSTNLWQTAIPKGAKLEGQPLIQMSTGCHRNGALLAAINDGILMPDVAKDLVSCHGSCYKNYDHGAQSGGSIWNKILTKARRGKDAGDYVQPMADFLNETLGTKLKASDFQKPKKGPYTKRFEQAREKFMALDVDGKAAVWNKLADRFPELYSKWQPQESQGVRVMHPDVIRKKVESLRDKEFLNIVNSPSAFIRGNQQGDWLMELRGQDKNGVTSWEAYAEAMLSKYEKVTGNDRSRFPKKLSVVTTGWYADVPMEVLRRIADKYGDHIVVQVTGPIDFPGPEGALRLQGFKKLHDAGLNPVMRLITDEFQVGGTKLNDRKTVEMTIDFLIDNSIRPEQVLETPLHLESPRLKTTRINPKDSEGTIRKKIESVAKGLDESWQLPIEEREVMARRVLERNSIFYRKDERLPEDLQNIGHTEVGLTYDTLRGMGISAEKLEALQRLGYHYKFSRNGVKQEGVFNNRCCMTGKCVTCDSQCSANYMDAIREGRQQQAVQILENMSPTDAAATLATEMNQLGQMRLKAPDTVYQASRSGEDIALEFMRNNPSYRDIRFDGVYDPFEGMRPEDIPAGMTPKKYLQYTILDGPEWVTMKEGAPKRDRPTLQLEITADMTPAQQREAFRSKLEAFKEQWGDSETLFQSRNPWYSVMEQVLEQKLPKTSSAQNMLDQVRAYQKKNEFKSAELEWAGLEDWLEMRGGDKVTREEVLEFVRQENLTIMEEVKRDLGPEYSMDIGAIVRDMPANQWRNLLRDEMFIDEEQAFRMRDDDVYRLAEEAMAEGDLEWDVVTEATGWEPPGGTRHAERIQPYGQGKDYFEMVLHIPEILPPGLPEGYRLERISERPRKEGELYLEDLTGEGRTWTLVGPDGSGKILEARTEADALRQAKIQAYGILHGEGRHKVSAHWNEDNVIVHMRADEREGPSGERVLMVQEIQADLAQEGREKPTYGRHERVQRSKEKKRVRERIDRLNKRRRKLEWEIAREEGTLPAAEIEAKRKSLEKIQLAIEGHYGRDADLTRPLEGIPESPWPKSSQWATQAMRRLVRYAAENGFDAIAWTPGNVQNQRWSLANQIQAAELSIQSPERRVISLEQKDSGYMIDLEVDSSGKIVKTSSNATRLKNEPLEAVMGKELAQKFMGAEKNMRMATEDLMVGGQPMRDFYDTMLPNFMKKAFGKKSWGKPQIGPGEIKMPGRVSELGNDFVILGPDGRPVRGEDGRPLLFENMSVAEEAAVKRYGEEAFAREEVGVDYAANVETAEVWTMPITPEMRAKATKERIPLFQNDGKPLGATTFERNKTTISFFEAKDLSTAPHEFFHIFMDDMQKLAYSGQGDTQLRKDWQTVIDHLGAKWGQELTTEQKETFARMGEAYLAEGKAPTPALQKAFTRLRQWVLNIYRSVRNLGVNMTDDMRGVFDRLLATEEEISAAKDFMELKAYWLEGEGQQLLGAKGWSDYKQSLSKAGEAADRAIRKRRITEYTKLLKKWKKDAEEISKNEPEVQFVDALRDAGGINRKAFEAVYGKPITQLIAREHPRLFRKNTGEIVQSLVDKYGMRDPNELLGMLTTARSRDRIAKEWVLERSREYDKAFDSSEAVISEEYSQLLAKEAEAIERLVTEKTGQPLTDKQIERLVQGRMGKMTLEQVGKVYMSERDNLKATMQMAAKMSREAFAAGDYEGALREKNRQRALIAKMRERRKISEEVQQRRKRLKRNAKLTKPKKGQKKLTVSWEHAEQIRALMSRYNVGIKTAVVRPDKLMTLEEFIRQYDDETGALQVIPEWLRNQADARKITQLNLQELRDLDNAVQVLTHLGRNETRLLETVRKENIDEAIGEMRGHLEANRRPTGEPQHFKVLITDEKTGETKVKQVPYTRRDKKLLERAKEAYDTAGLIKPEFIFRQADNYDRGPFYDYLFRWAADAEVREFQMWEDIGGRMEKIFDKIPMRERRTWGRKEHYVPNATGALAEQLRKRPFSREEILMVALNSGNEGNLRALMEGYGWDLENVRSITNMLTPKEWEVVRGIWGLYERIRPELEKTNRQLTGTEMELVKGIDVETPYGIIEGGYFPLKFDEELSWRAGEHHQKDIEATTQQNKYRVATTQSGMTKSRVGGAMPPRLKVDVVYESLMDSIHHTTHGVGVRDAGRLIQNPEFRAAFEEYMGADKYAQLMPWLQHIANPRPQYKDRFEYYLNKARMNATVVTLGLKATTALKQVSAYTLTADAVGKGPALEALKIFYAKPRETAAWVYDKSPYMRSRTKSWDREVADMMRQWDPSAWKFKVGEKYVGKAELQDLFFTWITMMDRAVAMPTWVAGYREGIKKYGGDEKLAVDHADMVVRTTQASASLKDLAGWQRGGPAKKILVPFYTAASVTLSRLIETKNKYSDGQITAGQALMSYFWVLAAQSMIETWAGKPWVPDEDTEWKEKGKEQVHGILDMFVGSFPIARDVGKIMLDKAFTGRYWGYEGPPAAGIIQAPAEFAAKAVDVTQKALGPERVEDKDYRMLRKKAIESGGYMFGLPANATNQAIDGSMALLKGETKNPFVLLFREQEKKQRSRR